MTNEHGGYELHAFIAEFYDTSYDRRIEKDVAFYVDYAKKANGRTLEMGCGTGRVLIPLPPLAVKLPAWTFPPSCWENAGKNWQSNLKKYKKGQN